ncbi:MAG TPA: hypothetical protein VEL79_03640 [Vicinamibacterales bacterium]|nr:hypothetical protein [Vicinamibacterales bacterium]
MRYVKTFLVTAPVLGLLGHFLAETPMPWWPDTAIFGAFMGALSAFVVMRFTFARTAVRHIRGAGRAFWSAVRRKTP